MADVLNTPKELADFLKQLQGGVNAQETQEPYRYVIYARKSQSDNERQVQSIPDQIIECQRSAESKGLNVIGKPIQEAESAKEPDIRPKFHQMLVDLQAGKFDGIISWHPDRLARNMKDAGEIIDLLDKQIIKDLQFVSFTFQNDSSGKMLLGIAFVLSKQYSDKLRDDVTRGMVRRIEEGKWLARAKNGYYKDRNQYLRPDGQNFVLIKKAWEMRLQNKTLEEIAAFLNDNHYDVPVGIGNEEHRPYTIDKKRLSTMFRDPFFTGVMQFGETIVNLADLYDFVPAIEVKDFLTINRFSNIKNALVQRKRGYSGEIVADLLRGAVICGECNQPFTAGITHKKQEDKVTHYFYYRCDTPNCPFRGKSVRANVIVKFAQKYLSENHFTTKPIYEHYLEEMKSVIRQREAELETKHRTLIKERTDCEKRIERIKELLLDETDQTVKSTFSQDLKTKMENEKALTKQIAEVRESQQKNDEAVLSYEKFIELMDNLPARIGQKPSLKELDYILRKIFLNFTIKKRKVASFSLQSPFKEFVEKGFVSVSGLKRT